MMIALVDTGEMPSMRLGSTPISNVRLRRLNIGALRGRLRCPPLAGVAVVNLHDFQLRLDLAVALGRLRADEVEGARGLLEREQVLGPAVSMRGPVSDLQAGNAVARPSDRTMASLATPSACNSWCCAARAARVHEANLSRQTAQPRSVAIAAVDAMHALR